MLFWYTIITFYISQLINKIELEDIEGSLEVKVNNQETCIVQADLRPDYVYYKTGLGLQIIVSKTIVHMQHEFFFLSYPTEAKYLRTQDKIHRLMYCRHFTKVEDRILLM